MTLKVSSSTGTTPYPEKRVYTVSQKTSRTILTVTWKTITIFW